MQGQPGQIKGPIWLPPVNTDWLLAVILVILGANIEVVPEEYRSYIASPLIVFVGMLVAAGLAAVGMIPLAFATAFALVNLVRIIPKKQTARSSQSSQSSQSSPGVKEGFVPSGTLDWVIPNKKWFVEKVLMERPVAIQEKEVSTYPIQA
jgi:hypothetical protein